MADSAHGWEAGVGVGSRSPSVQEARKSMSPRKIHRRPDADPRQGLEKYGKATFADPVNKKYPIDTPGRIKAAWPTSTSR